MSSSPATPASASTAPPKFSLWQIAIPAFGPTVLFGTGEGAILPMVPLVARDLGGSVPMAAFIITLIGIGSLVNNIPASVITMRYGERGAIMGAGLWSALGMLLCVLTSNLLLFGVGCFMVGMSQAVYNLARQTYVTEAVPPEFRARALSTLGGSMRIGMFIGPFIAAAAVHLFGLSAAFVVGIVAVIGAAFIGSRLPDIKEPHTAAGKEAPPDVTLKSTLKDHYRIFLSLGLAVLMVSAVRASRQAVIPLWSEHLALAPAVASMIYGVSGGIEMLLFYPAGRVMDVKGRRWVAIPSMLFMGIALVLMPLTTGAMSLLICSLVIGFGNGIGSGMNMTLGADFSPRHGRTYFLGVWRFLSDIGASLGPALLSLLAAGLSLSAGIVATGGLGLIGAWMLNRWIPRRKR